MALQVFLMSLELPVKVTTVCVSSWCKCAAAHTVLQQHNSCQSEGTSGRLSGGQRLQKAPAHSEDWPSTREYISSCRYCRCRCGWTDSCQVTARCRTQGTRNYFNRFVRHQVAEQLLKRLKDLKPPQITGLYHNSCGFMTLSKASPLNVGAGIAQGSILGPLLFII